MIDLKLWIHEGRHAVDLMVDSTGGKMVHDADRATKLPLTPTLHVYTVIINSLFFRRKYQDDEKR